MVGDHANGYLAGLPPGRAKELARVNGPGLAALRKYLDSGEAAAHRPLPADSEPAQAIAVLARAQQDAVWDRTTAHNKLRSHLREYFPAFLAAFADARGGIMRPEARAILAAAPAPAQAATLTKAQLTALLPRARRTHRRPGARRDRR